MTHTGYTMVDCTGLNLNTSSEQTISGFYAKAKAAFDSADKVTVTNLVAG